jgi:hypothetical protein
MCRALVAPRGWRWGSIPQGLLGSDCAQMYCYQVLLLPDISWVCQGGKWGNIKRRRSVEELPPFNIFPNHKKK